MTGEEFQGLQEVATRAIQHMRGLGFPPDSLVALAAILVETRMALEGPGKSQADVLAEIRNGIDVLKAARKRTASSKIVTPPNFNGGP